MPTDVNEKRYNEVVTYNIDKSIPLNCRNSDRLRL